MTPLESEIRRIVVEVVRDELARHASGVEHDPEIWDSNHLPPDLRSRDRFHRLAPKCPGALKVGRTWSVPREAWRAYRAKVTAENVDVDTVVARMLRAS